jgi:hypothetical protein
VAADNLHLMHHISECFKSDGISEWLLYFSRTAKLCTVTLVGEETKYVVQGEYRWSGKMNLDLHLQTISGAIAVKLEVQPSGNPLRRLFATWPLTGEVTIDSKPRGSCTLKNGYDDSEPVIALMSKSRDFDLEAFRWNPTAVICPLVAAGMDYEIVLEDFFMLDRERRSHLPKTELRRSFIGSARAVRYRPFEDVLPALALTVAVSELIAKDRFMRLE